MVKIDSPAWRPVPGWESYYEVSSSGLVRSLPRTVLRRNGRQLSIPGQLLSPAPSPDGYLAVQLVAPGRRQRRRVHVLVLAGFVGPRPAGLEGCHNNGNQLDNRLSNLRYDTHSENTLDSVRHGTHPASRRKAG